MAEAKKAATKKAAPAAKKTVAKKTTTAAKPAAKKAPAKKAEAKKAAPAKKVASVKKTADKKPVAKTVKKLGKIVFEFDGQQIDFKAIEKKAAKLGGDVYVVASEKKIFDAEGKSVDLF